jgi:hypothetical protein
MFYLKYCGFLTGITFHHRGFNHGLAPHPLPLKIAGVGVNTFRITDPHVLQKGALWSIAKSNSATTPSRKHS